MTPQDYITALRQPTADAPLRILMSACLSGIRCGFDGSANGEYPSARKLLDYKTCKVITFCPEEHSFGSPREMCDIHGGTGMDVLDGKAKVLSDSGKDWSAGMIKGAEKMLERAKENNIELAVMMDISAACGSTVIYSGNRFSENKVYQIGQGVAAALLMRNGITVISQRDFASLEALYATLDESHQIDTTKLDHRETEWYKEYF
jgi:uncharacterized protein YbbK (DUF523 family)